MSDQTIPAEKVRELIEYFEGKDIGIESYGILGRFRALLPTPPQPTTGLLGRWAKHDAYGDYIVRGVQGEMYPCKPDIFEATYEKAED